MKERTSSFGAVKQAKRGKFNLVDLLFLVLLAVMILAVVFLIDPFSMNVFGSDEKNVVLEYTVQIDYVEASLADNVRLGEEAISAVNRTTLGRVSGLNNTIPYSEAYYDAKENTVSMREYPDRYNLQITITSNASFEEGKGYTVSGTRIAVGGEYALMFPNYVGTGYCISMKEIG